MIYSHLWVILSKSLNDIQLIHFKKFSEEHNSSQKSKDKDVANIVDISAITACDDIVFVDDAASESEENVFLERADMYNSGNKEEDRVRCDCGIYDEDGIV